MMIDHAWIWTAFCLGVSIGILICYMIPRVPVQVQVILESPDGAPSKCCSECKENCSSDCACWCHGKAGIINGHDPDL